MSNEHFLEDDKEYPEYRGTMKVVARGTRYS